MPDGPHPTDEEIDEMLRQWDEEGRRGGFEFVRVLAARINHLEMRVYELEQQQEDDDRDVDRTEGGTGGEAAGDDQANHPEGGSD